MAQQLQKRDIILKEQAIAREKLENDMISIRIHMERAVQELEDMHKKSSEAQMELDEMRRQAEEAQQEAEDRLRTAAAKLKEYGVDMGEISDITGISMEEIISL